MITKSKDFNAYKRPNVDLFADGYWCKKWMAGLRENSLLLNKINWEVFYIITMIQSKFAYIVSGWVICVCLWWIREINTNACGLSVNINWGGSKYTFSFVSPSESTWWEYHMIPHLCRSLQIYLGDYTNTMLEDYLMLFLTGKLLGASTRNSEREFLRISINNGL